MKTGPSSAQQLLILCCQACWSVESQAQLDKAVSDEPELASIYSLAAEQDVLLLAYHALKGRDAHEWEKTVALLAAKNMNLQSQLTKIHRLLEQNGIRCIPYKGPTLSQVAYGSPGLRCYEDLDILLSPADVAKSVDLLCKQGYSPDLPTPEMGVFLRFAYEYTVKNHAADAYVELHWKFLPQRFPLQLTFEKAWQSGVYNALGKTQLVSLSAEMQLVVLAVHGCKHCWSCLLWISDIAALVHREDFSWTLLLSLADEVGARRCLLNALLLASQIFDLPLPTEVVSRCDWIVRFFCWLQRRRLFTNRPGWNLEEKLTQCLLRDTNAESLKFILDMIFYPTITDLTFVNLPARFAWAYYLVRPLAYPIQLLSKFWDYKRNNQQIIDKESSQ